MINFYPDENRVYSQNGEDGVIEAIFSLIQTTNKYFVEFGVEHGEECNTRLLRERGWIGLWMDSHAENDFIKKEFVTAENINTLLDKYHVPQNFDLLSIDIDGNDYWVWKAINRRPRVVVIEYNGYLPVDSRLVMKYDPNFVGKWESTYFGAGLEAMRLLGQSKGYTLAYVEFNLVNAFFIANECLNVPGFEFRKTIRTDGRPRVSGEWVIDDVVGELPR